jgi:hypothetical protein
MQKTNVNNNNNTALAKSIGFTILALVAVVAMLTTVTVIGGLQTVQAEPEPKTYCKEQAGVTIGCTFGTNQEFHEVFGENVKQTCRSHVVDPGGETVGEEKCSRNKDLEQ